MIVLPFALFRFAPVPDGAERKLSAIVLASVDAPLASLATVFVTDLRRPFSRPAAQGEELRWARRAAVAFALILAALAVLFARSEAALSLAFKAGAIASGPLLGVFLFGIASGRRGDRTIAAAFGIMAAIDLFLLLLGERGLLLMSWSWLSVLGAGGTFALAWAFTRPAPTPVGGRGA